MTNQMRHRVASIDHVRGVRTLDQIRERGVEQATSPRGDSRDGTTERALAIVEPYKGGSLRGARQASDDYNASWNQSTSVSAALVTPALNSISVLLKTD